MRRGGAPAARFHELLVLRMSSFRAWSLPSVVGSPWKSSNASWQGVRDQVEKLRASELRREVYEMDRQAQDWVGKVEKEAVESLTGYSGARDSRDLKRCLNRWPQVETMMEARLELHVSMQCEVHVVGLSHHSAPVEAAFGTGESIEFHRILITSAEDSKHTVF